MTLTPVAVCLFIKHQHSVFDLRNEIDVHHAEVTPKTHLNKQTPLFTDY